MSIFDILSGRKSFTKTPRTKLTGIGLIDVFTGAMPILKQPSRAALNTIEAELFDAQVFSSKNDFFAKTGLYQLWFNAARKNSSRGYKSPADLLANDQG